ncbi:MAG TPA: mannosyl-3-phosphoglycerate synthase [Ktedonobacteraceae bacterium]
MNIQTVQFPHILETRDLVALNDFLSHTAFVISHKNESIETLLRVLWYIPVNSTIIVVTNCLESAREELAAALKTRLADHRQTYLIHQKDHTIAELFKAVGVPQILGKDGKVRNGKGEGMYIGALATQQLGYLRWLIFYDADNFVPSALLEYTFALCRLFTTTPQAPSSHAYDALMTSAQFYRPQTPALHNVRICWSSKPDMKNLNLETRVLGRTSKVVSPFFDTLLEEWFGIQNHPITSSNAGEQGMTVRTATTLRFSSGFSVETFQLLDLFSYALTEEDQGAETIFQQYLSKSPHFHEKKGERHIKKMIEESLSCFFHFEPILPDRLKAQLHDAYSELRLERSDPIIYPALCQLPLARVGISMDTYALFLKETQLGQATIEIEPSDLLTTDIPYHPLLLSEVAPQDLLITETSHQSLLTLEGPSPDLLLTDVTCQDVLSSDILIAD